jgi:hypothetical protein
VTRFLHHNMRAMPTNVDEPTYLTGIINHQDNRHASYLGHDLVAWTTQLASMSREVPGAAKYEVPLALVEHRIVVPA